MVSKQSYETKSRKVSSLSFWTKTRKYLGKDRTNEKLGKQKQKSLGLEICSSLNFDLHVSSLCKKAGKMLSVLARLSNFMSLNQTGTLMEIFIESQFGYCPLVWMFHGRIVNKKINNLHERVLRIV